MSEITTDPEGLTYKEAVAWLESLPPDLFAIAEYLIEAELEVRDE